MDTKAGRTSLVVAAGGTVRFPKCLRLRGRELSAIGQGPRGGIPERVLHHPPHPPDGGEGQQQQKPQPRDPLRAPPPRPGPRASPGPDRPRSSPDRHPAGAALAAHRHGLGGHGGRDPMLARRHHGQGGGMGLLGIGGTRQALPDQRLGGLREGLTLRGDLPLQRLLPPAVEGIRMHHGPADRIAGPRAVPNLGPVVGGLFLRRDRAQVGPAGLGPAQAWGLTVRASTSVSRSRPSPCTPNAAHRSSVAGGIPARSVTDRASFQAGSGTARSSRSTQVRTQALSLGLPSSKSPHSHLPRLVGRQAQQDWLEIRAESLLVPAWNGGPAPSGVLSGCSPKSANAFVSKGRIWGPSAASAWMRAPKVPTTAWPWSARCSKTALTHHR